MAAVIAPAPESGDIIDSKYVLRERIGQGGMGSVFLADQPALARTVAIKILHPQLATNRELALRFHEEAVAASRVRHHGSVVVIDVGRLDDGTPYIVMEHVDGRTLGRVVAEEIVPIPRAIAIAEQILGVLRAAHLSGVVHADVKSDNFLIAEVDGEDHVTMIDFGLARLAEVVDAKTPAASVVSGTPEYMAPEVIRGERPQQASDLYGVGVILYELLAGATPFSGGTAADIMARHLDDDAIPPSLRQPERDIPIELDRIVLRALAKRPADRFPDAEAFAVALRGVARTQYSRQAIARPHVSHEAPTDTWAVPSRRRIARGSNRH